MKTPQPQILPLPGRTGISGREQRRMDSMGHFWSRNGRGWQRLSLLLVLVGTGLASGQSTNQTKRIDYSDFRIITERNIFNPRRFARSGPRTPTQPAARVDAFTLVGTMTYEKGPFAFFEGTSPEYRKVVKPADSIAGYKITNIAYNSVKLADQTNEIQLAVGMQMRREENGPWHISSIAEALPPVNAEPAPGSTPKPGETAASSATSAQPGAPAAAEATGTNSAAAPDDVLRRLMQRREQENNR